MRNRQQWSLAGEYMLVGSAAWMCLAWFARRPALPAMEELEKHFPVASLPVSMLSKSEGAHLVEPLFALIAGTTLLACALAVTLAVRSSRIPAARTLATSLACGSGCVGYVFFLRFFPGLGADAVAAWSVPLDALAMALFGASLIAGMRFFARFPVSMDFSLFIAEEVAGRRAVAFEERFQFLYRKVVDPRVTESVDERRAREERFFRGLASPAGQYAVVAALCVLGLAAMTVGDLWWFLLMSVAPQAALFASWFGFACMRYKYKRSLEEARRQIEWLYFGGWAAGSVLLLWAVAAFVVPLTPFEVHKILPLATFVAFAPVVTVLIGLLSLAISIFYRGSIDPNLAIRRTAVSTLLVATLTCLFVVAERLLATVAASYLNLGTDMSTMVAAALSAVALLPLRRAVDAGARRLVERLTPVTTLGDGPRHDAAVVFSDLSGYTSLTARDERSAMIAAALFHREARKAAERHGGRLVKTIGDAVHLELESAVEAVAAVRELHEGYAKAAAALDLPVLGVHSGVHYGEVMAAPDGDIYGTVVNVAARLQGQAGDGEIVVSDVVRNACAGGAFGDRGRVSLKNVPEALQLYTLTA
jgi:class 3 adenylate cyclase